MSQSVSWADLIEDLTASVDPPHASGEEPNFLGFLIPPPSTAGPPLAFVSGACPQKADNTTIVNQASSAKYDLKVYTPYTSQNMFDGMLLRLLPQLRPLGVHGCFSNCDLSH